MILDNVQKFQKMTKNVQKVVKGNPFTFWPFFLLFSRMVETTKNGQLRPGDNDFCIVEVIEVHFGAFNFQAIHLLPILG